MEQTMFKDPIGGCDNLMIIDTTGKIMYYEDFDDTINMLRSENVVGRSIFEVYPFFKREDFTIFKAIDRKAPVLNEYQVFEVYGKKKTSINSAFPLINESGVIGAIVTSVELSPRPGREKKKKITAKYHFSDIISQNEEFMARLQRLKKVSQNDSSVLICGETGTGKELIAHAIHNSSKRRQNPFVIQNCAAIPTSIMESILFGTAKGSFTGALDREGIFESARGGTIFLDEINSMPLDLQSKLLRAIENKSVRRVGETKEREIDVRIIAAANENLLAKVERGEFRMDLFYRLNVVTFTIPPLRERRDDILLLSNHYIHYYNSRLGKSIEGLSGEVISLFQNHHWKGNVRELKNVIEYALNIKDQGFLTLQELPQDMQASYRKNTDKVDSAKFETEHGSDLAAAVRDLECRMISQTYSKCRGNIKKTAETLGVSRQTLYNKLRQYNLLHI